MEKNVNVRMINVSAKLKRNALVVIKNANVNN
jgi:hypothetical protein